ncbi:MAG: insulinase family protein [Candidatus Magasanikbacteria bacterium]|nr:insulinase family protein [Candidatus Magasanikbacteria bacterium]
MHSERIDSWPLPVFRTTLPNGFTVITMADDSGLVDMKLCIAAGAEHEKTPGTAHLLEHCISTGETVIYPERLSALLELNAKFNATTSWRSTMYDLSNLFPDEMLEALKQLMTLVYDDPFSHKKIAREKKAVIQEISDHTSAQSIARQQFETTQVLHVSTRTQHSTVMGTAATVESIDAATLELFRTTWYTAKNSALIVVGTVQHEHVVELAHAATRQLEAGDRVRLFSFDTFTPGRFTFTHPQNTPQLNIVTTLPSGHMVHRGVAEALCAPDGILTHVLRIEHGINYGVSIGFDPFPSDYAYIDIRSKQSNLERVETTAREILRRPEIYRATAERTLAHFKAGYAKNLLAKKQTDRFARVHLKAIYRTWIRDSWKTIDVSTELKELTIDALFTEMHRHLNPDNLAWIQIRSSD